MGRFLRWATVAVFGIAIIAAIIVYPQLADRWRPAAPSATPPPTAAAAPVAVNTPQPTLALPPTPTPGVAAVVIAVDSPTATPLPSQTPITALPTPAPIATTSLLAGVTPVVAPPVIPAALPGGGATVEPSPTASATATVAVTTGVTVTASAPPTAALTPTTAISVTAPSAASASGTTPTVSPVSTPIRGAGFITATVTGTPSLIPTATRPGPDALVSAPGERVSAANTTTPLYAGPDLNYPIVAQLAPGDPLDIVARHTEGMWYLLANGAWVPAAAVDYPPAMLPLVIPTPTFTPTPTPPHTPTPGPTPVTPAPPTPSPTPTSLSEPICDCSADHYDCLGNVFSSQTAAQLCFDYCFREVGFDVHNLDPNLNGRACENLP